MSSFPELDDCVRRADPEGFLLVYFRAIDDGQNLEVPDQFKEPQASQTWRHILDTLGIVYSEDFISLLGSFWVRLATKQGKRLHAGFPADIFRLLKQGAVLAIVLLVSACSQEKPKVYLVPKETVAEFSIQQVIPTQGLHWKTPASWKEMPPSQMRVASFQGPGNAEISVTALGGEAGGVLANVNRWRNQIGLFPVSERELRRLIKERTLGGRRFLFVDFSSYKDRLVAAIFTSPTKTWFFKMTGPYRAIQDNRAAFDAFLSEIEIHENE